ncbi:unnamed protein product [Natator depressus]
MKTPLLFCLLSALLETGTCVSCEVCISACHSCTGSVQVCSEDTNSCGIIKTETIVVIRRDKESDLYQDLCVLQPVRRRSCFNDFGERDIHEHEHRLLYGAGLCPRLTPTLNGLRCPACYSMFSHHCSEEIIDCPGAQTHCIHVSGTMKSGGTTIHTTMKGCATKSACTYSQPYKPFQGFSMNFTTAECRPASRVAP